MGSVRIGTCSWADESLSRYWYPRGLAARERLAWYAQHFDTVEVDSTYYRLPPEEMVERWAERTPPGFVMHVKAFGVMTRHPVKLEQLPPELRDAAEADERGRVQRPSRELRAEVFRRFRDALRPLREGGKLGGILLQFPSYVVFKDASFDYLRWAREQLPEELLLVEFRHRSWLDEKNRPATLSFLEDLGAAHVIVDAPKTQARNLVPTVVARTASTAYVRFHGRNAGTWNVRGRSAAERFDYLYSDEELREWVEPMRELADGAEAVYAFFNNNGRSPGGGSDEDWVAQAATNAAAFRRLLADAGVPVTRGAARGTPTGNARTDTAV
ncbi:MAG: DUF72 domain-containing protein [Gaiellaceae bacterium]